MARRQDFHGRYGLDVRVVVVHVDVACDFFLHDLRRLPVDNLVRDRWEDAFRHVRVVFGGEAACGETWVVSLAGVADGFQVAVRGGGHGFAPDVCVLVCSW